MQLNQLRSELLLGRLGEAVLEPAPHANGWILRSRSAAGEWITLTDDHGSACVYHRLDSATGLAQDLGFRQIRVEERF